VGSTATAIESRLAEAAAWLITGSAAWLCCHALAAATAAPTPVDHSLPLLGVSIVALAWAARRTAMAAAITLGVPLLAAAELAVVDERWRLLLMGAIVAGALVAAVASMAGREGIPTRSAHLLSLIAVLLLRLSGWNPSTRDIIQSGVVLIGTAALIQFFASRERRVPIAGLALGIVIGLVTPSFPFAAALYPLVLALLGVAVRAVVREHAGEVLDRPLLYAAALGSVFLSVMGGRWLLWITAATLSAAMISRRRSPVITVIPMIAAAALIPSRLFAALAALRAWIAAPQAIAGAVFSPPVGLVSGALVVLAVVSRPTQAPLIALAIAVLSAAVPQRSRFNAALPTFAILVLGLLAWSGVPARMFPLPLAVGALAAVAAAAMTGRLGFVAAAAGLTLLSIAPAAPDADSRFEQVGIALAPAASCRVAGDTPVAVILSGANVAHLRSGVLLGQIDVRDPQGRETRRAIRVGDASDWGFLRQRLDFFARNPLPRDPRGRLIGYGYDAFLTGGGRVLLDPRPAPGSVVRVTAAASLPPTARLQIDALERAP
jgi:hypothetical protein